MVHAVLALTPVVAFLGLLTALDSFKLVRRLTIAQALAAGAITAVAALALQRALAGHLNALVLARYVAPLLEESLKLLFIVVAIARHRIAFPVEAGIMGFAVGTGFSLVENAHYLASLQGDTIVLWLVRGFGAAVLHGAATAIAAILTRDLVDRHPHRKKIAWMPALLAAVTIHSVYNHFVLLAVLPPIVLVVFERSERATREWVGAGLDLDVELLRLILSDDFGQTRLGLYLRELRARFPGPVVANMFCLLRVQLELSIRAKATLLAREAGLEVPLDEEVIARLEEVRFLERSIGPTGLLALRPLNVSGDRDYWHRVLLDARGVRKS
jgi:hypothetical protein